MVNLFLFLIKKELDISKHGPYNELAFKNECFETSIQNRKEGVKLCHQNQNSQRKS